VIRAEDVAATLERGRRNAEVRMTETVEVGTFKDDVDSDGAPIRVPVVSRYSGIGRIKYESLTLTDTDKSAQVVAVQRPLLSVPVTSPLLHDGDEVKVVASSADGLLVDRTYSVEGAPQAGQTTSHRYPLKELS
jgi:hypothetical protein